MKILSLMTSLMKKHIPLILLALLMSIFTILSNVGMLSTSSVLISRAALHPDVLDLMVLIVAVRFFGISRGVFRYLERLLSHNTTFKILSDLRRWFFKSFNENYSETTKEFNTGSIYTKLVNDVDTLKEFFLRVAYPLITAVLCGVFTAIFLSIFNKILSYVYILFYIFSGFILPILLFRYNVKLMTEESHLKREMNMLLVDILNGILEISVYSLKIPLTKQYTLLKSNFSQIQKKKVFITNLGEHLYSFSVTLLIALSLSITAPYVAAGKLSGIYYAMLPLAIMASFEALIPMPNLLYKYHESQNAGKNIFSIMRHPSCSGKAAKGTVITKNLSVRNVSIKDSDSSGYILQDISFDLPYGKKIALVGVSGSGKSSILKAILGFINLTEGEITLDDLSYNSLDINEIRDLYVYLEQNPYLFSATIEENLLIANPASSTSSIKESLKNAHVLSFIEALPNGLQTVLGQFGSNISGGEKQRLAMARAFLRNSPIVLLDEPTASLDIELEKRVISSIHEFIKDKSCIWVTHRLIHMDKMDEILLIDKGKIVERGTHKSLLDKKEFYYKLWKIQNQYIDLNS